MEAIEVLRWFNSMDGPGMSLRQLAKYCGISECSLSRYLRGTIEVGDKKNGQIRDGLQQMVDEMQRELNGICD